MNALAQKVQITVVGSGYVGLIAAVCFAEMGHDVLCVDNNAARVEELQGGGVPIYEEHLPELLTRHGGRGLRFTTDLVAAVRQSEAIFVAVGTPQAPSGEADLSYVEACVREISSGVNGYKVVIEKSTVPVLTSQWIRRTMRFNGANPEHFHVVSNPEFLREGVAIADFLYPDRIVVGADTTRAREVMRRIYQPLIDGSYYRSEGCMRGKLDLTSGVRYLETSAKSAELIKHSSNAFLAMKISFINAVANICEAVGSDIQEVAEGIGSDSRIGNKFLNAGIGYGGSCFPKDVRAFYKIAETVGYRFDLLQEVERINEAQLENFTAKLRSALWTLKGKKIGVLGLSFKGGTDDVRESPAIRIVEELIGEGCQVAVFDPAAMEKARVLLGAPDALRYASSEMDAATGAHALLVVTEWPQFARLNPVELSRVMRYPVMIDGRNLFTLKQMAEAGFYYQSMGRPALEPQSAVRNVVQPIDAPREEALAAS